MEKRVREISRFFVAPPRVFPLSVRARPRTSLSTNASTLVQEKCRLKLASYQNSKVKLENIVWGTHRNGTDGAVDILVI